MTSLRAPIQRPPSPTLLPLGVRLWLYDSIPVALAVIDRHWPSSTPVDAQLATEIALDTVVKGLLVSQEDINEQLSYNILEVLILWQDQARNGHTMGQMFREWIPHQEWLVIQEVVDCAQFAACFVRMSQLAQGQEDQERGGLWEATWFHMSQIWGPWQWLV